MKFMNYIENKDIVTEAFEEALAPVSEGWGYVLARWLGWGAGVGIINATNVHWVASMANLNKLLKNEQLKKYIKDACNKLLKEEQKKDKSVTKDCPKGPIKSLQSWWHGNDELDFFDSSRWTTWRSDFREDIILPTDVDGFNLTFFFDADHIDAVVVVFYSKDRDKFIGRSLPGPDNKEVSKMFHKE